MNILGTRNFSLKDKNVMDFYEPKIPLKTLYSQVIDQNRSRSKNRISLFFKRSFLNSNGNEYQNLYFELDYKIINYKIFFIIKFEPKIHD